MSGTWKTNVDGFGNFDLPDVIESGTVVLQNHKETVWHKIDFDALERKYPHVTWILEDSTYIKQSENHHNLPFYFLHHTIWHGIRIADGENITPLASDDRLFGPRHFCFMNNVPREYRVRLWERLKSDGLLNEYCSFLRAEKNGNFDWAKSGYVVSMRPPTFYDSVVADLFVETTPNGPLFFTEKTWKPLFYGKIPLGFGPQYYYKTLRDLGFHFPDILLDYTFDELENTEERFAGFYEQVKRFASLPLPVKENITEHNRRRCFELMMETNAPPDVPESHLQKKAEEYLELGRILKEEERERYWYGNK